LEGVVAILKTKERTVGYDILSKEDESKNNRYDSNTDPISYIKKNYLGYVHIKTLYSG
jgi:hypothetical protein